MKRTKKEIEAEYEEKMQKAVDEFERDYEDGHIHADGVLCELLVELGYKKIVEMYEDAGPKYFA